MSHSLPEAPVAAAQHQANAIPAPQPKALSLTSMILGLASIFFGWTFIAPILAVVFGILGLKRESAAARGMSITGIAIGGLFLLTWCLIVFLFIVGAIAAATAPEYSYDY